MVVFHWFGCSFSLVYQLGFSLLIVEAVSGVCWSCFIFGCFFCVYKVFCDSTFQYGGEVSKSDFVLTLVLFFLHL